MQEKRIYLDFNATTPTAPGSIESSIAERI